METIIARGLGAFENSPTALAAAIGGDMKRQNIEYWISSGSIPQAHRPAVDRVMGGKLTCEQMSADDGVVWARIPDKSWPWHPKGRPALDVTKVAA